MSGIRESQTVRLLKRRHFRYRAAIATRQNMKPAAKASARVFQPVASATASVKNIPTPKRGGPCCIVNVCQMPYP